MILSDIPRWLQKSSFYYSLIENCYDVDGFNEEFFNDEFIIESKFIIDNPNTETYENKIRTFNAFNYWLVDELPECLFKEFYYMFDPIFIKYVIDICPSMKKYIEKLQKIRDILFKMKTTSSFLEHLYKWNSSTLNLLKTLIQLIKDIKEKYLFDFLLDNDHDWFFLSHYMASYFNELDFISRNSNHLKLDLNITGFAMLSGNINFINELTNRNFVINSLVYKLSAGAPNADCVEYYSKFNVLQSPIFIAFSGNANSYNYLITKIELEYFTSLTNEFYNDERLTNINFLKIHAYDFENIDLLRLIGKYEKQEIDYNKSKEFAAAVNSFSPNIVDLILSFDYNEKNEEKIGEMLSYPDYKKYSDLLLSKGCLYIIQNYFIARDFNNMSMKYAYNSGNIELVKYLKSLKLKENIKNSEILKHNNIELCNLLEPENKYYLYRSSMKLNDPTIFNELRKEFEFHYHPLDPISLPCFIEIEYQVETSYIHTDDSFEKIKYIVEKYNLSDNLTIERFLDSGNLTIIKYLVSKGFTFTNIKYPQKYLPLTRIINSPFSEFSLYNDKNLVNTALCYKFLFNNL